MQLELESINDERIYICNRIKLKIILEFSFYKCSFSSFLTNINKRIISNHLIFTYFYIIFIRNYDMIITFRLFSQRLRIQDILLSIFHKGN